MHRVVVCEGSGDGSGDGYVEGVPEGSGLRFHSFVPRFWDVAEGYGLGSGRVLGQIWAAWAVRNASLSLLSLLRLRC